MRFTAWIAVSMSVALLAGCGTTQKERTTGGAATGAATGAGIGALGGPPGVVAGALIGGAAGAATGAATKPSQVNLGKPPWNNPQVRVPGTSSGSTTASSQNAEVDQLNERSLQAAQQGGTFSP
jgi:hypothetical protein